MVCDDAVVASVIYEEGTDSVGVKFRTDHDPAAMQTLAARMDGRNYYWLTISGPWTFQGFVRCVATEWNYGARMKVLLEMAAPRGLVEDLRALAATGAALTLDFTSVPPGELDAAQNLEQRILDTHRNGGGASL